MINRDIYQTDPSTYKLVNEGVANVNDRDDTQALQVLRYELEHFVCEGQYQETLEHVLETYLSNLNQAQQPGVWISGFYGSGKSHLVKMLRALWVNTQFPDGARARDLARLPEDAKELLKDLETAGRRYGGLHASSGTLGAGASGSVRLAILAIILKSAGLPERPNLARFVLWLRTEGIELEVRDHVEQAGHDWEVELDNFLVADGLNAALVHAKPHLFTSPAACADALRNLYPAVTDVSSDEMLALIRQALSKDGIFPLTLIALDELQQFIGEDAVRASDVQEAVEACCKGLGSNLIFVATGQTAITSTPSLKKLEGRFTVRFELSDADVEAVIRKTILAKRPDALDDIDAVIQTSMGEIARHLASSTIRHRQDDDRVFAPDYPILPVRRRFWEQALRVLDRTGTQSQLRNQLNMVHKAIQTNLDKPLGNLVPADYLYFDAADKLLAARELPRKIHEQTMTWSKGSPDERLLARACGLVFLINRLAGTDVGIRATVDALADLLMEDLTQGSSALRSRLPRLLDTCPLLMKVGDEYRTQTEESRAWTDAFQNQRSVLSNEAHRIDAERNDRIRRRAGALVGKLSLTQGTAKVGRDISLVLDPTLPADAGKKLLVWLRDGWNSDENSVRIDALQAGSLSPTIYVFVPKRSADDLRHQIMDFKAATATLDLRGMPTTPDGRDARASIETIRQSAEARIDELLNDCFSGARVYQGGGNEIVAESLAAALREAAENALVRLYPQFGVADHAAWDTVYAKAQKGDPDALRAVGDGGDPANHPVCKSLLVAIGSGKRGADLRTQFEGAPYGWSRDAVDGGLQVLLVAGLARAQDEMGRIIRPTDLERKAIGKATYRVESAVVTAEQKIKIRSLLLNAGIRAETKDLPVAVPSYLEKLATVSGRAGGAAPRPNPPDTTLLEEIRRSGGNEQLLLIYNNRDELARLYTECSAAAAVIDQRLPAWNELTALLARADDAPDTDVFRAQANAVLNQRLLLADPDPVPPLLAGLTQVLRDALNAHAGQYDACFDAGRARLDADVSWAALSADQRHALLAKHKLAEADRPLLCVSSSAEVLATLSALPLDAFADRIAALDSRFDAVLADAAALIEPGARPVTLPRRTLKTAADLENWLSEARTRLSAALAEGPIIIK